MRQQGYRLVQMWVPDVRSDSFAAEARRQSLVVGSAADASAEQDYIEAVSAPWDE